MKVGDIVCCKKDYSPKKYNKWITKDKEYKIFEYSNGMYYIIDDEGDKNSIIMSFEFFYTEKEYRKLKLKNIYTDL